MIFDYYSNLLFSAKPETVYFILGVVFNLYGIFGIIEGIQGVSKGQIFLGLKRHKSERADTRTGTIARIWGIFYLLFGLLLVGIGTFLMWVFIASFFKK